MFMCNSYTHIVGLWLAYIMCVNSLFCVYVIVT